MKNNITLVWVHTTTLDYFIPNGLTINYIIK
jgi:hypothetical protein